MDLDAVLRALQTDASGVSELGQVTTFEGRRDDSDGVSRDVMIMVWDGGSAAGDHRYMVEVTQDPTDDELDDDESDEIDNIIHSEGSDLIAAIQSLPWSDLD